MDETFGTRVQRIRLRLGYKSIDEASRETGIKRANLDNVERKGNDVRLTTITEIRDGFGVTTSELLDGISGPGAAEGAPVPSEPPDGDTPPSGYRPRRTRGAR